MESRTRPRLSATSMFATVLELDAGVVVGEELPEVDAAHHLAQANHEVLGHLGSKAVKVWRMEINNRI